MTAAQLFDRFLNKGSFLQLEFTSDCHCHLLPGVDDGSGSAAESEVALREMMAMGIRSAVLTPHMNPDIYPENTESLLRQRYAEFTAGLPKDISSGMTLSLGAEYMVVNGLEHRDLTELLQFKPGRVLIEMSYLYVSTNMEKVLFELSMANIVPVIAHPERYLYLAGSLDTFERYRDMGAEYQMNLLSMSGAYGSSSMKILEHLLTKGWYSHYGTDAHNPGTLRAIASMRYPKRILKHI